jgi:hypothetical protein
VQVNIATCTCLCIVPVESDLQEIVKEISIMKQCDSPYIVKYFGSYFKDADLWVEQDTMFDKIRCRNVEYFDCLSRLLWNIAVQVLFRIL